MKKAFFLSCLALFYSLITLRFPLLFYDEGVIFVGAERILHGDIPYKDFWTNYPPGSFWLLAAIFKLFGNSILVARIVGILLRGLLTGTTYLVATKVMGRGKAFLLTCVIVVWMFGRIYHNYPLIPALFCIQVGVLFFNRYLKVNRLRLLLGVGLWGGVVVLFRNDLGFAFFSIISLWILLQNRAPSFQTPLQELLYFHGGFLLSLTLPFAYLLFSGVNIRDIAKDLIIFPFTVLPKVGSLPMQEMDPQDIAPLCLTLFCLALGFSFLISRLRLRNQWSNREHVVVVLFSLGVLSFFPVKVRMDFHHLFGPFTFSLLVAGFVLERWIESPKISTPFLKKALFLIPTVVLLVFFWFAPTLRLILRYTHAQGSHPLPRAKGLSYSLSDRVQVNAIRYIQSHVSPVDRIYVGLTRHRKVDVNDVLFYFLAERMPATKYHQLCPGIVNLDEIQQDMVRDLERYKVPYIVLWKLDEAPFQYGWQREGSSRLDDFIRTRYQLATSFGPYFILKLKEN